MKKHKNTIIFISIIISLVLLLTYANNLQSILPATDNTNEIITTQISEVTVTPSTFFIEVLGEVNNPGVFEVSSPILVFNAIELAGGYAPNADIPYVHQFITLSKKVSPEMKIYIPPKGKSIDLGLEPWQGSTGFFSINTATSSELEDIKGIGKVTAEKIIKNRPFSSWEELKAQTGIRQSALDELKTKAIL